MPKTIIVDQVAYLQARLARLFMERHQLTPEAFLVLNSQKGILRFLRVGYEPFHLTGDEGILEELDAYVFK